MSNYYNEFDEQSAAWLRANIAAGLIPDGLVDSRSIADVQPEDLAGFDQCHFFAGIGGWPFALRLAGWPDNRPIWTGSCPCQPFSAAGQRKGADDERHLWPHLFRLIDACRPAAVMGEQVAGALGYGWFDGVRTDLAGIDYASRCVDIPAAAVDSPQIRQRLYWIAVAGSYGGLRDGGPDLPIWGPQGRTALTGHDGGSFAGGFDLASADGGRRARGDGQREQRSGAVGSADGGGNARAEGVTQGDPLGPRLEGQRGHEPGGPGRPQSDRPASETDGGEQQRQRGVALGGADDPRQHEPQGDFPESWGRHPHANARNGSWWAGAEWISCHDGKARRVSDAGAPLLAHGVPNRVLKWRGLGNAICPPLAAEAVGAFMDLLDERL